MCLGHADMTVLSAAWAFVVSGAHLSGSSQDCWICFAAEQRAPSQAQNGPLDSGLHSRLRLATFCSFLGNQLLIR